MSRNLLSRPRLFALIATSLLWLASSGPALAQTSAFTYQGRLDDSGSPANGLFDFQFKLFDMLSSTSQIGTTITLDDVTVTDGSFSVLLDFSASVFTGADRFLEIGVRPGASTGAFTLLSPRQQITSTPYAIRSLTSTSADALSPSCVACVQDTQINTVAGSKIVGEIPPGSVPSGSGNYIQNTSAQQAASNFNISGNGTAGGTVSANTMNALTQYNIGGSRVLSIAGSSNLFAGGLAGASNTTGGGNSFFGESAGLHNTEGTFNSFFGAAAGLINTMGGFNSFFGVGAGSGNTTGDNNSFFGESAGFTNSTGRDNSFFGRFAGRNNFTGNENAFFGRAAGINNFTGNENAFFGRAAGINNFTGNENAFFGQGAGGGNTTGSDNTIIGFDADVGSTNLTNATAIGARAFVTANDSIVLGSISGVNGATANTRVGIGLTAPLDRLDVSGNIRVGTGTTGCVRDRDSTVIAGTCSSDIRLKRNITPFPFTLDSLVRLQPVYFYWKSDEYPDQHLGSSRSFGLVAQEVEKVMPDLVADDEQGFKVVRYNKLPFLMLQAIKDLKAENDRLKQRLAEQEARLRRIEEQLRRQ